MTCNTLKVCLKMDNLKVKKFMTIFKWKLNFLNEEPLPSYGLAGRKWKFSIVLKEFFFNFLTHLALHDFYLAVFAWVLVFLKIFWVLATTSVFTYKYHLVSAHIMLIKCNLIEFSISRIKCETYKHYEYLTYTYLNLNIRRFNVSRIKWYLHERN